MKSSGSKRADVFAECGLHFQTQIKIKATAPPPPPPPATGRAGGRGGLCPVRPGRVAPSGPGGFQAPRRDQSTAKRAHGVSGDVGHPPDPS